MAQLYLHDHEIKTVFDLLGDKENDITFSLGWALTQSEKFQERFLKDLFPQQNTGKVTSVHLQKHEKNYGGYTDIEIKAKSVHLIVEAKRGANLPERTQLERYVTRLKKSRGKAIVVMAECEPTYALTKLPKLVNSVPIRYRSWKQVTKLAKQSVNSGTHAEKRLLREFAAYMEALMDMQNQKSNQVYVIALGGHEIQRWSGLSWRDYVIKRRLFFQPLASRWAKEPPNYLGFRYDGKLQSIHHIEKHEIVDTLRGHIRVLHRERWMNPPHRLCRIGPAIKPFREVRSGKIRDMRVSAALDLLLTSKTISEARDKTNKRLKE